MTDLPSTQFDSELSISELLDRVGRVTRGLQFVDGLSPAQWEALRFLARANRYSRGPSALAEFLGTTKGTISQTLIALENKGYLRRRRGARDKRSVDLELTAAYGQFRLPIRRPGLSIRLGEDDASCTFDPQNHSDRKTCSFNL